MMKKVDRRKAKQEQEKKKRRNYIILILLILLLMGVTVGYATLSTSLTIGGVSRIKHVTWDVHFENIQVTNGSEKATLEPTIGSSKDTIHYAVDLLTPGDFYEFSVDVKNGGKVDAKLDELPIMKGVSKEQDEYINYTIKHADDSPIVVGEVISTGKSQRFKIRIEYDNSASQLPLTVQNLNLSVEIPYEQA